MTIDCTAKLTLLDILQLVGNKLCYITRLERRANFQLDRNELSQGLCHVLAKTKITSIGDPMELKF